MRISDGTELICTDFSDRMYGDYIKTLGNNHIVLFPRPFRRYPPEVARRQSVSSDRAPGSHNFLACSLSLNF